MIYLVTIVSPTRYRVALLCLCLLKATLGLLPAQAGQGATVWLPSTLAHTTTVQQQVKASSLPLLRLLAQPAPQPVALPAFVERLTPILPTGLRGLESSTIAPDSRVYKPW